MPKKETMTFQQAMERLEEIVRLLEEGSRPLEESVALYEEGGRLTALCQQRLAAARLRIEEIDKEKSE